MFQRLQELKERQSVSDLGRTVDDESFTRAQVEELRCVVLDCSPKKFANSWDLHEK